MPLYVWSQSHYKIELNNLKYELTAPVKARNGSYLRITLTYSDNSTHEIYRKNITEEEHEELWGWNLNPPIITDKIPKSFRIDGYVDFRSDRPTARYDETHSLNICQNKNYTVQSNSGYMSLITFTVKVSPFLPEH
ncbi:hypothetical protein [Niabella ginsengisoli]|uniref:Uncharacterized protein n=1 Tax=Niabella ginsengisoli TaxID=522298 RepID=A0ABS9SI30_9BACT|nr:hypothetical protein [Niabella ginsengisoli]MCH5597966.1 hypothetical protein [Niabella ginsengisoli]